MESILKMNVSMKENVSLISDNYNATDYPGHMDEGRSIAEKTIIGIILGLLICLTLIGNGLVVTAVVSFERLRSVANMFIVSLAIADITVALLVMPVSLITEVSPNLPIRWIFCYFWVSCDVTCCTASILHLCVISLDRYIAITAPYSYPERLPKKRAAMIICAVWVCSMAIAFPPIYLGWFSNDDDAQYGEQWKIYECGLKNITRIYAVVSASTSFYVPLIVMIIAYVKIFHIAKKQVLEINKLYVTCSTTDSPEGGRRDRVRRRSQQITKDVKAIRTLGILMGVFIICWLPFFIMYITDAFCDSCKLPRRVVSGITWLGYINSFFNPCVYALMNTEFRNAFYKLLSCSISSDSSIKTCFKRTQCGDKRTAEQVQL